MGYSARRPTSALRVKHMAKMRLTQRAVDRLPAPDPSGKQVLLWDTATPGFGLLVSGKTPTKTFIVQRKIRGTRDAPRITIDRTDVLTVEQARERAAALLLQIGAGIDPKAERRKTAARNKTLRQAVEDYTAARKDLAEKFARATAISSRSISPLGPICRCERSTATWWRRSTSRSRQR
jgi:hypothetical protein